MELFKGDPLMLLEVQIEQAHFLAQFAGQISSDKVWKNDFPIWLLNIVNFEIFILIYSSFSFPQKKKKKKKETS